MGILEDWLRPSNEVQEIMNNALVKSKNLAAKAARNNRTQQLTHKSVRRQTHDQADDESDNSKGNSIAENIKAFVLRTPTARWIDHTIQTGKNQIPKVLEEARNRNYNKALASALGMGIDYVTSAPTNTFGYNMYTAPIKDIVNSQYNRAVRNITGDPNYTAIKGQRYGQYDMSEGMWNTALEMQRRVANGEDTRAVADKMAKERVDPNYSYSDARLLTHPFNDTAHYLWTIGGQSAAGDSYWDDLYDNAKRKTDSYRRSLEKGWSDGSPLKKQFGRALRAYGGLVTSQDEDPEEQKQVVRIPKQK